MTELKLHLEKRDLEAVTRFAQNLIANGLVKSGTAIAGFKIEAHISIMPSGNVHVTKLGDR